MATDTTTTNIAIVNILIFPQFLKNPLHLFNISHTPNLVTLSRNDRTNDPIPSYQTSTKQIVLYYILIATSYQYKYSHSYCYTTFIATTILLPVLNRLSISYPVSINQVGGLHSTKRKRRRRRQQKKTKRKKRKKTGERTPHSQSKHTFTSLKQCNKILSRL